MRWTWWSLLSLTACLSKPGAPAGLTDLAPDEAGASELVLEGGDLFWTIGGPSGAIRACAIEACVPRSLTGREVAPHALLVEGDEVLWATGDEVRRASRTATDAAAFLVGDNLFGDPIAFRHISSYLFFSAPSVFFRCDYEPGGRCLSNSTLDTLRPLTGPMTLDANGQLWAASATQLYGADAAADQIKRRLPASAIRALVADATHVFALETGGTDVLAWPLNAPDGTPPTRIATPAPLRALALDGQHLFVGSAAGTVLGIPLLPELGAPEPIASGLPMIDALAVAPKRIYVAAGGHIGWLPKP
jgi:hypothetical protein